MARRAAICMLAAFDLTNAAMSILLTAAAKNLLHTCNAGQSLHHSDLLHSAVVSFT